MAADSINWALRGSDRGTLFHTSEFFQLFVWSKSHEFYLFVSACWLFLLESSMCSSKIYLKWETTVSLSFVATSRPSKYIREQQFGSGTLTPVALRLKRLSLSFYLLRILMCCCHLGIKMATLACSHANRLMVSSLYSRISTGSAQSTMSYW